MDSSALDDNYDFLNQYISKITGRSSKADNKVMEDDNEFYDTPDEDQAEGDDGIEYGVDDQSESESDYGARLADEELAQDEAENTTEDQAPDEEDDTIYGSGETDSIYDDLGGGPSSETPGVKGKIAANESQGKYTAFNPKGGGSGAVGKYQFRWDVWKDSIGQVTGIKNKEKFLKSPAAQEKYYAWYEKNYLIPTVDKLKPYNRKGLSKDQMMELVHFRGESGAKKYLQGIASDKPESYNMSTSKYIATKQTGGNVPAGVPMAMTSGAQHMGLNNQSFNHMVFPMEGVNEFRGLDDGTPVYLEDETGKKKKLKGKKHKTKMTGYVFESRFK